jgi:hypothetical protein
MTGSTWARARQLLAEAAEYPPADRERYILEHCTAPELQREVIALLATPAPLSDIVAARALQLQPGVLVSTRRDHDANACSASWGRHGYSEDL